MANLAINDFKGRLTGGGARANLFEVVPLAKDWLKDPALASFMIKAAQLPSSLISPITVPFRGRQIQLAGDRSFEPWTITVINDSNFKLRDSFENWMDDINAHSENVGFSNPEAYMRDFNIYQLDKTGARVKSYYFRNIWPSGLSAIDVSYDAENTIEEFSVEFQVTYWESNTTS
jgi:hypothetical protein